MNKLISFSLILYLLGISHLLMGQGHIKGKLKNKTPNDQYTMVVEGYDWGAAVSKIILPYQKTITKVNKKDFSVLVNKHSECMELSPEQAQGERSIIYAYVSDAKGKKQKKGNHLTLVLTVAPNLPISSPIQYTYNEKCSGNNWVDYKMTITDHSTNRIWDTSDGRIMPLIDQFDCSGSFTSGNIKMSYAAFAPKSKRKKQALIIWLHGGGEGGTDASIPLIANKAANYAAPEMQRYFDGAHVLVPQCPGAWMHNEEGVSTRGKENDIYNESLMALIRDYVANHPEIDQQRIYVGGCSNGGYMALKLILLYPNYFAAGYISALAYLSEYITDNQIKSIKHVPIWFIHSKDDQVTVPEQTVVPVYKRLMAAGAKNVHFSYYDHVIDLSGFFGGENYHHHGHWSWIYSHVNHCRMDFDGHPVLLNGKEVSIMEWMATQRR